MCFFCERDAAEHHGTRVVDPPALGSLSELRMTEEEYKQMVAARDALPSSVTAKFAYRNFANDRSTLRVVGGTDDASALLELASGVPGQAWVEMKYGIMDSIFYILLRLEKMLRVPMHYWVLAGDGVIYSPGNLVMAINHFMKNEDRVVGCQGICR
ncbi:hypothetical protein WOLCODRAFT_166978 [Wolfiporia cocos MD-104 SS10]|uniref:Uncharacterized protein n=1 Tax=Wolfiporia cocos (strain MD-104) TaxID=742152 RepID=A0A2H3J4B8_WOLCO|nr:hypothetical protein WOLCODRAFT_166978 [Wolfiporia cocos MD-104 SS10]